MEELIKKYKIIKFSDQDFPNELKNIKNPPKELYAIGDIRLLKKDIIAIVGTRKATDYGIKMAKKFSKSLTEKGVTVISGMALGIDTVANTVALGTCGNTIAVLGSGFNNIFPKENTGLFYKIIENGGLIISEYEPNKEKQSSNFPKRNRIITGLAKRSSYN